jgi:dihydrolipoamide dehydrogenase
MFDAVIIGGGPGGYVAAIRGAQLGGKVALVEGNKIGGVCLNVGCIPTKALVHSALTYINTKNASRYGVNVRDVSLDLDEVMAYKERTVRSLVDGVERLLRGNGITVYHGWAKVPSPGKVEVTHSDGTKEMLQTKNIILATGSSAKLPPVSQESIENTISFEDALSLNKVPETMIVIGGGVLGIEFSCIWNAFGTKVQVLELSSTILPPVDDEIARRLIPIFRRKGIQVNFGVSTKEVRDEKGLKLVSADTRDGTTKEFTAQVVLVAMGRSPNFGGIALEELGVEFDARGIKVNDKMQTNIPGIYAIGDVVGRTFLAPVASAEGIVAVENILGHEVSMDYSVVPSCVFSIPECASVGLKESEVKERGIPHKVSKFPFGANSRAQTIGETDGFVKVIGDADTGKILGMHILGPHADELIHQGALAIKTGLTARDVSEMIYGHPTLSEASMEASYGIKDKAIHLITR